MAFSWGYSSNHPSDVPQVSTDISTKTVQQRCYIDGRSLGEIRTEAFIYKDWRRAVRKSKPDSGSLGSGCAHCSYEFGGHCDYALERRDGADLKRHKRHERFLQVQQYNVLFGKDLMIYLCMMAERLGLLESRMEQMRCVSQIGRSRQVADRIPRSFLLLV